MRYSGSFQVILGVVGVVLCVVRVVQAQESAFGLFAYGEGISGLLVHYVDGLAQLGNSDASVAGKVPVYFTTGENSTWIAHPHTSTPIDKPILYMTKSSSTPSPVGFTTDSEPNTEKLTNVWSMYGNYVLVNVANANFYAHPITSESESGWYALTWSESESQAQNAVLVTLRTIAPASSVPA